ncbi:D-3-phosphoglycerate dehydrogenase [Meredithblackwellia eburnea MCA 4105]
MSTPTPSDTLSVSGATTPTSSDDNSDSLSQVSSRSSAPSEVPSKPRVYALDKFDPVGTAYAKDLFDLVSPGDDGWDTWRDDAVGLLVGSGLVTAEDIAQCKSLKYISRHGVGYDKVDIPAAKTKGIVVTNCPGVNASAVAEVAVALTCTLARQISSIDHRVKLGEVVKKQEAFGGMLLSGKTVGLLGGGNIGQQFARMMHSAFGCRIIVYDPYLPANSLWKEIPHTQVASFDEDLLPVCDIVSIHVPLLPATKDMISKNQLKKMKKTALLINTARGGIINEEDLLDALENEVIAGAGIDAWVEEPPTIDHYGPRLRNHRLIATPHIGAATSEVQSMTCMSMCDHMLEMMLNKGARDRVC